MFANQKEILWICKGVSFFNFVIKFRKLMQYFAVSLTINANSPNTFFSVKFTLFKIEDEQN